jgi:DnaK suppressor protein
MNGSPAAGKPSVGKSTRAKRPASKVAGGRRTTAMQKKQAERTPPARLGPETRSVLADRDGRAVAALQPPMGGEPSRRTTFSDEELVEFRELLLAKRHELVGDMNNLSDEARRADSPGGTASTMPIHMADLGSDTWEQELTLGLIENERTLLREIDEALDRIDSKTYGICIATNKPIGKARLRFKPWARYCIEYARKQEQGLA